MDAEIIRTYRLYPVIVQHYAVQTAFAQKVSALALREQVQSRDVFDLKLLLDAGGAAQPLPATAAANLAAAIENALAVDYDAFAGQVLAFLEPEYQEHYGSRKVWAELQEQVVDGLEGLQTMNQIEALQRLRTLAAPVVESRDVAAVLQVSTSNATTILRRLAPQGMIVHLSRGRWLVNEKIDRLALPELILRPIRRTSRCSRRCSSMD